MRIVSAAFVVALFTSVGCSSTVTGTGTSSGGTSGTSGGTSSGTSGSNTPDPATATYDALFGPPANAALTPDSIQGVWAGSGVGGDVRLKISGSSVLVALRCSGAQSAIGLEMAIRLSSKSVQVLESKATTPLSNYRCSIEARPLEIPICAATADSYSTYNCIELVGTRLNVGATVSLWTSAGSRGHNDSFTKLSD